MSFRRRVGAVAEYKRSIRKLRRDRAKGIPDPPRETPFAIVSDRSGGYDVTRAGARVASGFDTTREAQEWIDAQ